MLPSYRKGWNSSYLIKNFDNLYFFKLPIWRFFSYCKKQTIRTIKYFRFAEAVSQESGDSVTFVIPVEGESDLFLISVGRHIGLVRWSPSDPPEKTTTLTPLAIVDQKRPSNRINDGKCDHKGRLWAGESPIGRNWMFSLLNDLFSPTPWNNKDFFV